MEIRDFQDLVHAWAVSKGWASEGKVLDIKNPEDRAIAIEKLALIHSEVSEALEELRAGKSLSQTYFAKDGKPLGFPSELADIIIRTFNLISLCGIDAEFELRLKHTYNEKRPFRHGGKLC